MTLVRYSPFLLYDGGLTRESPAAAGGRVQSLVSPSAARARLHPVIRALTPKLRFGVNDKAQPPAGAPAEAGRLQRVLGIITADSSTIIVREQDTHSRAPWKACLQNVVQRSPLADRWLTLR